MTKKATPQQVEMAILHATALEDAASELRKQIQFRHDIDKTQIQSLSIFVLTLAGGYRQVANSKKVEE